MKKLTIIGVALCVLILLPQGIAGASFFNKTYRQQHQKQEIEKLQQKFQWWPTDATPGAVKDMERGGYWWYPSTPGKVKPWGNRGYIYVFKIIFDYKEATLPPPEPGEMRPSLLVRKIIKNVKIYFDYDKAGLREDAREILNQAVRTLGKNLDASILITGNADTRGSEGYNEKLGQRRAAAVEIYMMNQGIEAQRIRIVSRGKLDAAAPVSDLFGMQKDRNAQFVIAEVEEVLLPYQGPPQEPGVQLIEEGKYLVEQEKTIESAVQVSTIEYVVKKGDTLSDIAQEHLGSAHRWVYLFELNKDRIKNPDRLREGQTIILPVE